MIHRPNFDRLVKYYLQSLGSGEGQYLGRMTPAIKRESNNRLY